MRKIYFILYYAFAKHLPKSTTPIIGKLAQKIRRFLCSRFLSQCGDKLNVEDDVYLGNGQNIVVGNEVGLSSKFKTLNRILTIGNYVMIGEETIFFFVFHNFDNLEIPISHQGYLEKTPLTIGDNVWIGIRVIVLPK
jgi:maltose O-acetyltransferase